jgi:hypothetical protein
MTKYEIYGSDTECDKTVTKTKENEQINQINKRYFNKTSNDDEQNKKVTKDKKPKKKNKTLKTGEARIIIDELVNLNNSKIVSGSGFGLVKNKCQKS